MRTHGPVVRQDVVRITCDRCGLSAAADDPKAAEFLSHHDVGGYGSVFGDGTSIGIDLCQGCIRDTLGQWLRLGRPEPVLDASGRDPVAAMQDALTAISAIPADRILYGEGASEEDIASMEGALGVSFPHPLRMLLSRFRSAIVSSRDAGIILLGVDPVPTHMPDFVGASLEERGERPPPRYLIIGSLRVGASGFSGESIAIDLETVDDRQEHPIMRLAAGVMFYEADDLAAFLSSIPKA